MATFDIGNDHISVTEIQDETTATEHPVPVVYGTSFVATPMYRGLHGYGTTPAEAIVDLLRVRRDRAL